MARTSYSYEKFQREKRKAEKRQQRLAKRQARQAEKAGTPVAENAGSAGAKEQAPPDAAAPGATPDVEQKPDSGESSSGT